MAESGLTEFLQQIPAGIIAMFCVSGIALAVVVVLVGSGRLRGKPKSSAPAPMTRSALDAAMPDLDALVRADSAPLQASRSGGESVDSVPVLTLLRDVTTGGLMAQIGMPDGKAVDGIGRTLRTDAVLGVRSSGYDRRRNTDDDM